MSTPIPMETTTTRLDFVIKPDVTESTCPARMCKSGSAIDIKKPSKRPAIMTIQSLFDFAMVAPIDWPIGVIPISTPIKKIDNPMIIKTAPMTKRIINDESRGDKVKFKIKTMTVMGSTAYNTSFNFETSAFKNKSSLSDLLTVKSHQRVV